MKIAIRSLILLAISVWLGALIFFPFVAQSAFSAGISRQAAGLIIGASLSTLHKLGLISGLLLLVLLSVAQFGRATKRPVYPAILLVAIMMAITALSQFGIIPRMERYRIAAGGSISLAAPSDHNRVRFEALHKASVRMEGAVMTAGLLLVVTLAWLDSGGLNDRALDTT